MRFVIPFAGCGFEIIGDVEINSWVLNQYVSFVQDRLSVQLTLHQYIVLYSLIIAVFIVDIIPFPPDIIPLSRVCQDPKALLIIFQEMSLPLLSNIFACNEGLNSTFIIPFVGLSFEIVGGTFCISCIPSE
jgi:hypothetical protein